MAHRAATMMAMEPAGLKLPLQDNHQFHVAPEVDLSLVHFVPGSASVAVKVVSFAHQNNRTTNILKSLLADWDARMKTVHSGDSAHLPGVPQAEKKAADKACLCRKLHICVCSPTGKVVLRTAASLIAKLEIRTPYTTPARRDLVEGKLALHLRRELFGKVNFLWHLSWMCLSPYLPQLDADKGRQPIHARPLPISWSCMAQSRCWIQH